MPTVRIGWNPSTLSIGIKTAAITLMALVFFYQDLAMIFANALQDEASLYVLVIPFLFLYLVYRKRRMLRATVAQEKPTRQGFAYHLGTISGVLMCALAVVLYWFGSYTFNPLEYHVLTLPVFVAGLVLVLFNPQTLRQLAFPILFLAFLQPLPTSVLYGFGSALSVVSSEASSGLVSFFGIPSHLTSVYANPTIVITRPHAAVMNFTVDLACSGIFSLLGFVLFAVFVAYVTRGSVPKKLSILFFGLPLIVVLNIARISVILSIGYYYGEVLALQVFHLLGATVLLFLGTLLILVVSDKAFKKPPQIQPCKECGSNVSSSLDQFCQACGRLFHYPTVRLRRTDVAKILILALAVGLLVSIQAPVFALTKGPAQITVQGPTGERGTASLLPSIEGYNLSFDYRDTNFEQLTGQDASLLFSYRSLNASKTSLVVGVEIASSRSSLHEWELCLVTWPETHGYQPQVSQLDLRDVQILQNPPILARYFAFRYTQTNDTQVVLYWFETSTFTINNTARLEQVKISVIAYPVNPKDVAEVENQLQPVASRIAGAWDPIKTWTQVALALSLNGPILAAVTIALLATTIVYQAFLNTQEKRLNLRLFNKLSLPDQQLLQVVGKVSRSRSTTREIVLNLQNSIGTPVDAASLEKRLLETEKTGLIEKRISNREDEPVIVWKSQSFRPSSSPLSALSTTIGILMNRMIHFLRRTWGLVHART